MPRPVIEAFSQRRTAETRVLGWFRASLAVGGPLADQQIQWLLETALALP